MQGKRLALPMKEKTQGTNIYSWYWPAVFACGWVVGRSGDGCASALSCDRKIVYFYFYFNCSCD